jgi:hypothetical protein
MKKIKTAYVWPPASSAPPFWEAWDDDLGADSSPYGYGPTEAEAIADLERQLEEMESAQ